MVKNIQFESSLTDDREYVYIVSYKKNNKTQKTRVAIQAMSIGEAHKALSECEGKVEIVEFEKISKSEYRKEKL